MPIDAVWTLSHSESAMSRTCLARLGSAIPVASTRSPSAALRQAGLVDFLLSCAAVATLMTMPTIKSSVFGLAGWLSTNSWADGGHAVAAAKSGHAFKTCAGVVTACAGVEIAPVSPTAADRMKRKLLISALLTNSVKQAVSMSRLSNYGLWSLLAEIDWPLRRLVKIGMTRGNSIATNIPLKEVSRDMSKPPGFGVAWRLKSGELRFLQMKPMFARAGLARLASAVVFGVTMVTTAATASDVRWVSAGVRGMVIHLVEDHWEEVAPGQELANATLKTLRSGHLTVATGGPLTIDVGPNSTIAFRNSAAGAAVVFQYEGALTLSVDGSGDSRVTLKAGDLTLTGLTGKVKVVVDEGSVRLDVGAGTVTIQAAGTTEVVKAGAYLVSDDGSLSAAAGAQPVAAADIAPIGARDSGNAGSHRSDNAGGNAGGGNAGAGNAGAGNAGAGNGGSGNSNAGSGNSNAGGNGEYNGSGSNNAGGNGSSNAGSGNNNAGGNGGNSGAGVGSGNAGSSSGNNGGASTSNGKGVGNNGNGRPDSD